MKTILVDAVGAFIIEGQGIFKEMHELLEKFSNPKVILTNANDGQIKVFGLDNVPYPVFTLKHNPDKPNPEYFKQMLNWLNLKAEDVVYFEHNIDAVKSAESVGIKSYYYDGEKKDLDSLKAFLIENL